VIIRPYVGITDFTNFEQVECMQEIFKQYLPVHSNRQLHVGVMMSYKTLNDVETKWAKAFPPKEMIASIFASNETYNCLHYADYDRFENFSSDVLKGIEYGGEEIHAVQLDMVWPWPRDILKIIRNAGKSLEVILQVGKNAIEQADNNPAEVVRRLEFYADIGVLHRVLLDKSMGRGLGMDAAGLIPFVEAIKKRFPELGLVAAGGLGPDSIHLVEPLAKEFPEISIDAQGKLRPSGNALDPIDWDMAGVYLIKALELLE